MEFPNLNFICTEERNLALPDLLSRTISEEHFTKSSDIAMEIPDNVKLFFARTPFGTSLN